MVWTWFLLLKYPLYVNIQDLTPSPPRRFDQDARTFYNRKAGRTNRMIAHSSLAHKLARAAYYIMRDGVEFDHRKLFA